MRAARPPSRRACARRRVDRQSPRQVMDGRERNRREFAVGRRVELDRQTRAVGIVVIAHVAAPPYFASPFALWYARRIDAKRERWHGRKARESSCIDAAARRSRCCSSIRAARSGRAGTTARGRSRKGEFDAGEEAGCGRAPRVLRGDGRRASNRRHAAAPVTQSRGKTVHAFAAESDFDAASIRSNTFELEWPPRSGRMQAFPEIDRAAWFTLDEARRKIVAGQRPILDELSERLGWKSG